MNETVAMVFMTDDLTKFKVLDGNRKIKESHRQELIASIDKHGFIMNPIIVNENFEVIDGQTRLAACKELGVPVYYIVVPKIGIDECELENVDDF